MSKKKTTKKKSVSKDSGVFSSKEEENEISLENQNEIYSNINELKFDTDTKWSRFRWWSHKYKRRIYLVFAITLILGFTLLLRQESGKEFEDLLSQYFRKFNNESSSWIYQIGSHNIDKDHLRRLYPLLLNYTYGESGAQELRSDNEIYQEFIKQQFETDLMAYAALQTEVLKNPEAQLIIENALRKAIADYYLYSRIKNENNDFRIHVTNTEVMKFYETNKNMYEIKGLDRKSALPLIRGVLIDLRTQRVRQELQDKRKAVLESLKNSIGPKLRDDK